MLLVTYILCLLPSLSFVAFEQEVAPAVEALGAEVRCVSGCCRRWIAASTAQDEDGVRKTADTATDIITVPRACFRR